MRVSLLAIFCALALIHGTCHAAQNQNPEPADHSSPQLNDTQSASGMNRHHGKQTGQMMPAMQTQSDSLIQQIEEHAISGTDVEPNSTPHPMLMTEHNNWMLMFHGEGFLADIQQSGPRGADKLFSTNWLMPMAQRRIGKGKLTLRTMLSLEPATVSDRRYPELFQEGETAYGLPIVDGQHPHNFFMELAGVYDCAIGDKALLTFYAAPVGDPALGPPAFPHRASAAEDPIAPLGHHLQDSTHIADDVVTFGATYRGLKLEASGFHGREPGEDRWDVDQGKIDSWSTRATVNPAEDWSIQYSIGQLHAPEALFPAENIRRMTASLMYNRPLRRGNWASSLVWGRNQSLLDGNIGNGYLLESTLQFLQRNFAWTRIENVDRTNEVLIGEHSLPSGFAERYFARVQAYTAGYDREFGHIPHVAAAIGGQVTWYGVPDPLRSTYGAHPVGGILFIRLRAF
ncbi:MAG: hypothetical protein WCF22_14105 [Candidatus Sulfotelmatobacter sp.]